MIPYGRQEITQDDIDSVVRVLKSDFLTQGPTVPKFERVLCDLTRSKYAIATNSATSALHIACLSLGLNHGDILWTSPISFVASANCAYYCGASVDFVDVESDTGLMSINDLKAKLKQSEIEGKLPKIIIPVHFAGQSCDMKEIFSLSIKYGFKIIEDAAHAVGASYMELPVGGSKYSDITVFSFHPVKIITSGEGGAALTNNQDLAEKMALLRSHGITRDQQKMTNSSLPGWYYEQVCLGFNYRMTDIHAAIGISQLKRLDSYLAKRRKIAQWYDEKFINKPISPLTQRDDNNSSYHLYVIRVDKGKSQRDKLYKYLIENGISVNLHYIPIYRHPFFERNIRLNGAEEFYESAITLPIFPSISKFDLDKVVQDVSQFYIDE